MLICSSDRSNRGPIGGVRGKRDEKDGNGTPYFFFQGLSVILTALCSGWLVVSREGPSGLPEGVTHRSYTTALRRLELNPSCTLPNYIITEKSGTKALHAHI